MLDSKKQSNMYTVCIYNDLYMYTYVYICNNVMIGAVESLNTSTSKPHDSDQQYLPASILSARGSWFQWRIEAFQLPFPQFPGSQASSHGHSISGKGFSVTFEGMFFEVYWSWIGSVSSGLKDGDG